MLLQKFIFEGKSGQDRVPFDFCILTLTLLKWFLILAGGSRKPHVVQENAKVEAGPSSPETTVDMKEKWNVYSGASRLI